MVRAASVRRVIGPGGAITPLQLRLMGIPHRMEGVREGKTVMTPNTTAGMIGVRGADLTTVILAIVTGSEIAVTGTSITIRAIEIVTGTGGAGTVTAAMTVGGTTAAPAIVAVAGIASTVALAGGTTAAGIAAGEEIATTADIAGETIDATAAAGDAMPVCCAALYCIN